MEEEVDGQDQHGMNCHQIGWLITECCSPSGAKTNVNQHQYFKDITHQCGQTSQAITAMVATVECNVENTYTVNIFEKILGAIICSVFYGSTTQKEYVLMDHISSSGLHLGVSANIL